MLSAILGIGNLLGQFLGGSAKGAAEGRMTEAQLRAVQDRTRSDQYSTQQNAEMQAGNQDLARKAFSEDARGGRTRQAILGDLLANWSPTSISTPGIKQSSISGGLQNIGAGGKAAGSLLNQQALMKMLEGDQFTGGKVLPTPGVQGIPQASGWEKLAGIGGLIGSGMGAVGQGLDLFGQSSVPSMPGASQGPPSQAPGQSIPGVSVPDAPPIQDIIDAINALTNPTGRVNKGGL
jgi:hypothetical protein